ncbi:MAG: hypothetical protein U0401_27895 [Anaerolineae bacterium]
MTVTTLYSREKMHIRAAVIREKNKPLSIEAVELEEPRPAEVLVRMVGGRYLPHRFSGA